MKLVKFRDYIGKKSDGKSSPSVIKASDLDDNFAVCQLIPEKFAIYTIDSTEKGTSINFTADKRQARWIEIDICVDGVAKKMMVLGTDPYEAPK